MTRNAWHAYYRAPDPSLWTGRADSLPNERYFQHVQCKDLTKNSTLPSGAFALLGFASDTGVQRNLGRVGAAQGPSAFRQALAKLPIPKQTPTLIDVGNILCDNDDLESAQAALGTCVALLLQQNVRPLLIGGGHEIAWGHYQGLANMPFMKQLGIINFDAHFDLRPLAKPLYGSSGTPFLQIAQARHAENLSFDYLCVGIQPLANTQSLFDTAQQLHVTTIFAEQVIEKQPVVQQQLEKFLAQHPAIYLTICLDVFANSVAPGVSAPQPLGLHPQHVLPLLRHILASGNVVSLDIAELSPPLDSNQQTAQLAASLATYYLTTA